MSGAPHPQDHNSSMEFLPMFVEMANLFKFGTYVEIGIKHAITFNRLSPLVQRAVACDIDKRVEQFIIKNPNVEIHIKPSLRLAAEWKEPIDFLFIDGLHTKEMTMNELDAFLPHIRVCTGIIAFHDTHPITPDGTPRISKSSVWETIWVIRHEEKYKDLEVFTFPGPAGGLSLVRNAPKHFKAWLK